MSVPVGKRNESDLNVLENAKKIKFQIFKFLDSEFYLKKEHKGLKSTANFTQEDLNTVCNIFKKYSKGKNNMVYEGFSDWFVNQERESIMSAASEILKNLNEANSIYAYTETEMLERKTIINKTIGLCDYLLAEIEFVFFITRRENGLTEYTELISLLTEEKKKLKNWRQTIKLIKKV